jgi:mono/diheme cytochrome c family protein
MIGTREVAMHSRQLQIMMMVLLTIGCVQLASRGNSGKRSVGEDIFRNRCTVCHGLDGGGETMLGKKLGIPDLRAEERQLTDDAMMKIISTGKGFMPSFKKKLSQDGINEVIAHVKKLKKDS